MAFPAILKLLCFMPKRLSCKGPWLGMRAHWDLYASNLKGSQKSGLAGAIARKSAKAPILASSADTFASNHVIIGWTWRLRMQGGAIGIVCTWTGNIMLWGLKLGHVFRGSLLANLFPPTLKGSQNPFPPTLATEGPEDTVLLLLCPVGLSFYFVN